jgi:hypothetical protein
VDEQASQGDAQSSHFQDEVFPYCPEGQIGEQLEAMRKFGEEQAVQVVREVEHFTHGAVQGLQILSTVSPLYK